MVIEPSYESMIEIYGHWGEYPRYPLHEWQYEVSEDYTRLGYWDWCVNKLNEEKGD
jgi:hypothetical protein